MDNTTGKIYCSGCKHFFASNSAHSKHRIGDPTNRHCMTEQEMRDKGMDSEPKNVRLPQEGKEHFELYPVWFDAVGREKMRAAFQQGETSE